MEEGVCREDAEREEQREYLCIAFVCWNESEQAGGSFRMHMRGVEGGGSWALVWRGFGWSWKSQVLKLRGNIPFSGYTSSLVVNLTPFPPNTGPQMGQ